MGRGQRWHTLTAGTRLLHSLVKIARAMRGVTPQQRALEPSDLPEGDQLRMLAVLIHIDSPSGDLGRLPVHQFNQSFPCFLGGETNEHQNAIARGSRRYFGDVHLSRVSIRGG